jgi:hypothetical protein
LVISASVPRTAALNEELLQLQTEAEVVRPPGVAPRGQRQAVGRIVGRGDGTLHHAVVEDLQVALAVQLVDALAELPGVGGLAHLVGEQGVDGAGVALGAGLDAQELDARRIAAPRSARVDDALELRLRHAQGRQPRAGAARCLLADVHGLFVLAEIQRREVAQRRVDDHVAFAQGLALAAGVVPDQDGEHLVRDLGHGVQLAALQQRKAAVDHDEHVDAHLARHVDGQVGGQPAVHQHAAVGLHRREHAGRGQAGAHGCS